MHLIKKFGIPLRGRYLWSALYVNRLEAHLKLKRRLNKSVISKAAIETIDEAKNALKKRLSRLQKENHDTILQELCWVVIQSDLLDRPTKVLRDRDHQMISEAFAVVETEGDSLQGTLKEYLAMDVAKEWFRKEKKDMYYKTFKEYLRFSTNDAASFGKAAEWFLALVRINTHNEGISANKVAGAVELSTSLRSHGRVRRPERQGKDSQFPFGG